MQLQQGLKSVYRHDPESPTFSQKSMTPLMCHNIIDGRYHTKCGHFYSMSTFQKDCGKDDCLFSSRHAPECKASSCVHKMAAPTHNPIRISNTRCGECMIRAREGTGTLGVGVERLNC